jgi:nucleotide-binding universal stress UspA family protein
MKQEKVQQILVYTDFTPLGDLCLEWGIFFAKKFEKELLIIHVINHNTYHIFKKETIEEDVDNRLKQLCKTINEKHEIPCKSYYEEGCTCTIINTVAEANDCFFNILGVHGKGDPQFMSGHSAVKIIRKARIPYFVVQKNSAKPEEIRPLLFPVDLKKEMKEQTGWITYLAKHLVTEIDIFTPNLNDEALRNNVNFCSSFLRKFDLTFNKVISNKKFFGFNKSALEYAVNNKSMFMTAISTKELSIFDWAFGPPEVSLVSNKQGIPIFIVNPKKDLYVPCI